MQEAPEAPVSVHTVEIHANKPWVIFGTGCKGCKKRVAVSIDMREAAQALTSRGLSSGVVLSSCPFCRGPVEVEIGKKDPGDTHKPWWSRILPLRQIARD